MIEFFAKNYYWFLVIAVILVFSLVGYIIDSKDKKGKTDEELEKKKEIENLETITNSNMTLGSALENKKEEAVSEKPAELEKEVNADSDLDSEEDNELKMIIDEPDN